MSQGKFFIKDAKTYFPCDSGERDPDIKRYKSLGIMIYSESNHPTHSTLIEILSRESWECLLQVNKDRPISKEMMLSEASLR